MANINQITKNMSERQQIIFLQNATKQTDNPNFDEPTIEAQYDSNAAYDLRMKQYVNSLT